MKKLTFVWWKVAVCLLLMILVWTPDVFGQNTGELTSQLNSIKNAVRNVVRILGGIAIIAFLAFVIIPKYMQNDPDANKALRSLLVGIVLLIVMDSLVGLIG